MFSEGFLDGWGRFWTFWTVRGYMYFTVQLLRGNISGSDSLSADLIVISQLILKNLHQLSEYQNLKLNLKLNLNLNSDSDF